MKVAVILNDRYKGENKDYFLLKYWENESAEIYVISCRPQKGLSGRTISATLQIISFLPSASKYDVILTGFQSGIIYSILRKIFMMKRPLHIIFDPMAGRILVQAYKGHKFLVRSFFSLLLSPVNSIICTCESDYLWWKDNLGFGKKVYQVRWGLDSLAYLLGEKWEQCDYIFSAGRTARDFPTLISAAEGIKVKFVIVAGEDAVTKKTGLEGSEIPPNVQVIFETPFSQYIDLLLKSKIVVVPLQNIPITVGASVLLNAMSIGKPVIATRLPAMLDYIKDGETGFLVKPGDVQDMREKILFLLEHPDEAQRMGNNALREVEQKFTTKVMSQNIGKIIDNVYNMSTNNLEKKC